jgi:amidophosphoribosyltransferase
VCGIAGYVGTRNIISTIISLLIEVQHRGQEAAGISLIMTDGRIDVVKGRGYVLDVFNEETINTLRIASDNIFGVIGHVRYSTTGEYLEHQAQPVALGDGNYRIAIAFNGTIANYIELAKEFNISSNRGDVFVLAEVIYKLALEYGKDVVEALKVLPYYVIGGYSLAVATSEPRIAIARDPYAFRPLAYAYNECEFVFASETSALECVGFNNWREVLPGEIVVFDGNSVEKTRSTFSAEFSPCIFEYVYFSRPDSIFNSISVYKARIGMGVELALTNPAQGDVVIPVPDSSRPAAIGFSKASGIPLEEGIIANKYVGRGFIAPPFIRDTLSKLKYGFVREAVNGKRVVLVDDSIVRGTTMRSIVRRLREVGAKEVHVRIASPPFRYPCFMGIDISSREELLAWRFSDLKNIAKSIEADSLGYNTVEGLRRAVGLPSACFACFTGIYPFKEFDLEKMEKMISRCYV